MSTANHQMAFFGIQVFKIYFTRVNRIPEKIERKHLSCGSVSERSQKYPDFKPKSSVIRSENTDNSGAKNTACMLAPDKGL